MRTIYVDVVNGSDTTGTGAASSPYKTLTKAVSELTNGDEIAVSDPHQDSTEYVFKEAATIVLDNFTNVTIRFMLAPKKEFTSAVWKPTLVTPAHKANLAITNCSGVTISGAVFMSQSPLTDHAHAISVTNSSNIAITNCRINKAWEVDNSTHGKLFNAVNSNVKFSNNVVDGLNNSYSNSLSFIAVDGAGDYEIYSNEMKTLTFKNAVANNGWVYGVYIGPQTRKVTLDGLVVHNIKTDLADHGVAVYITSDSSTPEFLINGVQASSVDIGILAENVPVSAASSRVKRSTFYNTRKAIKAVNATLQVYNCAVQSTKTRVHTYPPGHAQDIRTYGVFATSSSYVDVLNSNFTEVDTVFCSEGSALVDASHIVWYESNAIKYENTGGKVNTHQFVRRVSPQYVNITSSVFGNFEVSGNSPCVDTGKKYGDSFLGIGPDIGALERSRDVRVSDLPALVARTARFLTRVPLTNIDIEGMIVRGIETYDPDVQAGREGSALRDISVKPLVGMLDPYTTELEYIRDNLSFSKFETLSDSAADDLAANLFVTRKVGSSAAGVVRIYFEAPTVATIPAEVTFTSLAGLAYRTLLETTISSEEMALNFEENLYYVDVLVEAEETGTEYNIAAGQINSSSSPLPAGVVAITNISDIEGGATIENNSELRTRIATAITVRDLVTKKGITYVMGDLYDFLTEVRPIGFKDPEMLRDEILGYHIGGKVDIYVKTRGLFSEEHVIESVESETVFDLASFGNIPIMYISSVEVLDPATLDGTDIFIPENRYELKVNDPKTRFSIYETQTLHMDHEYVGLPVKITYLWVPELGSLQDWVESSDDRVVCADLYVKHFAPAFVDFALTYFAPTEIVEMKTLLEIFVEEIKSTQPLQVSDIVEYCYFLGATHVIVPMTLVADEHLTDGTIVRHESEDEIWAERTSRLIPRDITVAYLGADPFDTLT